jgi:hypothetical protein
MYRLLRLPIRQTSTTNVFLRTYASRQTTPLPTNPPLTEGEQHIFNKLTKELEPSELLVQDVSGRHPVPFLCYSASCLSTRTVVSGILNYRALSCMCVVFRWLWFFLCHYHCEREARGAPDPQAASENQERSKGGHGWVAWTPGLSPPPTDGALSNEPLCSCL